MKVEGRRRGRRKERRTKEMGNGRDERCWRERSMGWKLEEERGEGKIR